MSLSREETIKIPFYFCFNHFDMLKQLEGILGCLGLSVPGGWWEETSDHPLL